MKVCCFDSLPEEAAAIRRSVFMEEQGFTVEFDAMDETATHLVLFEEEKAIAACRIYRSGAPGSYGIGRLAVLAEYRGKGYGEALIREAERVIREEGGRRVWLSAQTQVKEFYRRLGYKQVGGEYLDEHRQHVRLQKELA